MTERDQIAAILGVMHARGTIKGWKWGEPQNTVVIEMVGVTRQFTFLRFWTLFQNGEQAICCGAGAIELRS